MGAPRRGRGPLPVMIHLYSTGSEFAWEYDALKKKKKKIPPRASKQCFFLQNGPQKQAGCAGSGEAMIPEVQP